MSEQEFAVSRLIDAPAARAEELARTLDLLAVAVGDHAGTR